MLIRFATMFKHLIEDSNHRRWYECLSLLGDNFSSHEEFSTILDGTKKS